MSKSNKIALIVILIIAGLAICGIFVEKYGKKDLPQTTQTQKWQDSVNESDVLMVSREFLNTKVNYPSTLKIRNYSIDYEEKAGRRFVIAYISFKCANAYGVYSDYLCAIKMDFDNGYKVTDYYIE